MQIGLARSQVLISPPPPSTRLRAPGISLPDSSRLLLPGLDDGSTAAATASDEHDDEMRRAAEICRDCRDAVRSLMACARDGGPLVLGRLAPLVERIVESVARDSGALVSLARLKGRGDYTPMHAVAVAALMVALARSLALDDETTRLAALAGLVHDLGKARLPEPLLDKPGLINDAERQLVRTHPLAGWVLLSAQPCPPPAQVLDVCLHHHERFDGSGYPDGLAGERIGLLARMGAVCDVYDALSSNRPYRAGWDPSQSIARMAAWQGAFDEKVFAAFVRSLGLYPTGSLVRLASHRLAVVVGQNPGRPIAPVVKAFYSVRTQTAVTPERIDLAATGSLDRIVARESASHWRFTHLDELWADAAALQRARG